MGVGNVQGGSGESYVYKDAYARYNMVSAGEQNNYTNNGGNIQNESSEWVSLAFGFAFPGILMLPFLILSIIFRVKAQKELQRQQWQSGQSGRNGLLTGTLVMNIIGIVYQAFTLCALIAFCVFFLFVVLHNHCNLHYSFISPPIYYNHYLYNLVYLLTLQQH